MWVSGATAAAACGCCRAAGLGRGDLGAAACFAKGAGGHKQRGACLGLQRAG